MIGGAGIWTPGCTVISGQQNLTQIIKSIFSVGGQGFAYDPNDLTTMWQDQAKLLPVTGEGQPVWHILDKSGNNNHAFATSSATRPILQRNATTGAYYLAFDGVDDFLQTNNIDFTSTDKVGLFAGVRKLSDANAGVVLELGANYTNAFRIQAPSVAGAGNYDFRSGGATVSILTQSNINAPTSNTIVCKNSISENKATMRVSGFSGLSNTSNQGGGVFRNDPLYIGRRSIGSLPFNGHLYSLIGIGRLTTDSETIALEKSIAKNTGVAL